jgi:hypothetical protein
VERWTIFEHHERASEYEQSWVRKHNSQFLFKRKVDNFLFLLRPKWIVLDGDIDPMWIESLNTVMDDNKVLTLASNERIALTKEMRLLFEISNLKTATPATGKSHENHHSHF